MDFSKSKSNSDSDSDSDSVSDLESDSDVASKVRVLVSPVADDRQSAAQTYIMDCSSNRTRQIKLEECELNPYAYARKRPQVDGQSLLASNKKSRCDKSIVPMELFGKAASKSDDNDNDNDNNNDEYTTEYPSTDHTSTAMVTATYVANVRTEDSPSGISIAHNISTNHVITPCRTQRKVVGNSNKPEQDPAKIDGGTFTSSRHLFTRMEARMKEMTEQKTYTCTSHEREIALSLQPPSDDICGPLEVAEGIDFQWLENSFLAYNAEVGRVYYTGTSDGKTLSTDTSDCTFHVEDVIEISTRSYRKPVIAKIISCYQATNPNTYLMYDERHHIKNVQERGYPYMEIQYIELKQADRILRNVVEFHPDWLQEASLIIRKVKSFTIRPALELKLRRLRIMDVASPCRWYDKWNVFQRNSTENEGQTSDMNTIVPNDSSLDEESLFCYEKLKPSGHTSFPCTPSEVSTEDEMLLGSSAANSHQHIDETSEEQDSTKIDGGTGTSPRQLSTQVKRTETVETDNTVIRRAEILIIVNIVCSSIIIILLILMVLVH